MPKALRPYSRVYWEARDDPRFALVWSNDRVLGCWVRLLVNADAAWPASADLYFGIDRKSLRVLTEAGLVDVQPSGAYRIHGLDKERTGRSEYARDAANSRWSGSPGGMPPDPNGYVDGMPAHPSGSADGMRPHPSGSAESMPSRDEPSKAEPSKAEPSTQRARPNGSNVEVDELRALAEELTQQSYVMQDVSSGLGFKAVTSLHKHGLLQVEGVWRRVAEQVGGQPTLRQLVLGADDILDPIPSAPRLSPADRKAQERDEVVRSLRSKP